MHRRTSAVLALLAAHGCFYHPLGSQPAAETTTTSTLGEVTGELTGSTAESPTSTTESPTSTTGSAVCGDGQLDPGEQCDDGNQTPNDGCEDDCSITPGEYCGNGVIDPGEQCDDGNGINNDSCHNNCTLPIFDPGCGNGVLDPGEQCDDGNNDGNDACTPFCTFPICGDGHLLEAVEQCDDGDDDNTDGCLNSCMKASCGDGYIHANVEECDDGDDNSDSAYGGCTNSCVPGPRCGDGVVNGPEQCDDGTPGGDDLCNACEHAPRRYVFVTSMAYTGELGGLVGADTQCALLASAAKIGANGAKWLAWLSDGDDAPATRMDTSYKGWYAVPGSPPRIVAKGWMGLTSGTLVDNIDRTEAGAPVDMGAFVWSNTKSNGELLTPDEHCEDWTSGTAILTGRLGDPSAINGEWTNNTDSATCDMKHHIYCVEN